MTTANPITIADPAHGSQARILPSLGFNCFQFSVPGSDTPLEILWSAAGLLDGTARPTGSGIPLLFPFAGRIGGTSFEYNGQRFELVAGDGQGNAIHGFVFNRPWRVTQQLPDRVSGEFQASVDDESLLARWPADFRISASYGVAGNTLACEYVIENPDSKPLPFAFGTHPYFRLPIGGNSAEDCMVTIPVGDDWELRGLLPTGKSSVSAAVGQLAEGMKLSDMRLDNVFGKLAADNHRIVTTIRDPLSGRSVTQHFDDQFTACVVFNPPHREAVCIEPYTTLPDPFALAARGVNPQLRTLAPGESFRTRIEIRVE